MLLAIKMNNTYKMQCKWCLTSFYEYFCIEQNLHSFHIGLDDCVPYAAIATNVLKASKIVCTAIKVSNGKQTCGLTSKVVILSSKVRLKGSHSYQQQEPRI